MRTCCQAPSASRNVCQAGFAADPAPVSTTRAGSGSARAHSPPRPCRPMPPCPARAEQHEMLDLPGPGAEQVVALHERRPACPPPHRCSRASVTCGVKRRRSGSRPMRCKAVSILFCSTSSCGLRSTPTHSAFACPPLANVPTPASTSGEAARPQRRQREVDLLGPVGRHLADEAQRHVVVLRRHPARARECRPPATASSCLQLPGKSRPTNSLIAPRTFTRRDAPAPAAARPAGSRRATIRRTPSALGWMPSGWFSAGSPATPSRKNGS